MYLDYFGLRQKPFLITPDPAFLYPSVGHQQALAHLQYGLGREGGFLLLTGEVGTGKTTLCRLFMDDLPEDFRLAYVLNTKLESGGLLAGICRELGIDVAAERDVNTLVEKIYDNMLDAHARGLHTLVVIEEAQNLSPDVLETLRLLTNLETSTTKLMHILLIGQPELLDTLRLPGLRQLNQRVVSRSHLGALSPEELTPYIQHRLKMAGTERPLFTPSAIRTLHRKTGGIPRLVNLLAEHCLIGAYATSSPQVSAAIVRAAANEILTTLQSPVSPRRWSLVAAVASLLVVVLVAGAIYSGVLVESTAETPVAEEEPETGAGSADIPAPVDSVVADIEPAATPIATLIATPEPVPAAQEAGRFDESVGLEEADAESEGVLAAVPAPGVYQQMLNLWGVEGEVQSEKQLCDVAADNGLQCVPMALSRVAEIKAIDRPLLVRVFNDSDGLDIYLVKAVREDQFVLGNRTAEKIFSAEELESRLEREGLMLWRPPQGYTEPLAPGEASPLLVASLVRWLTDYGYLSETLVSGGVYDDYLADRVRAFQQANNLDVDGILGLQTLLRLTAGDSGSPSLSGSGG